MSYKDKFVELLEKGFSLEQISENIYINYNAYNDVDSIYKLRKEISTKYQCDIHAVKLVGSAQTGFGVEFDKLLEKEPSDYDFAIVDPHIFIKYYQKVNLGSIYGETFRKFSYNFTHGKLHPLYQDRISKKEIEDINSEIQTKLGLQKKVSICFYLSEKCYIDFLCEFLDNVYMTYLKEKSGSIKPLTPYPTR